MLRVMTNIYSTQGRHTWLKVQIGSVALLIGQRKATECFASLYIATPHRWFGLYVAGRRILGGTLRRPV